jgi:exportin-7
VWNKGQRISFGNSSVNGILLFREISVILCAYGSRLLQVSVQQNIYLEKYKGVRLMLNTLTNALSGNYVNFGVFSLYSDKALQNALEVSLQICLQISLSDVIAYAKLSHSYFSFMEILFRNHMDVLSGLDSTVFVQLITTIQEGLQSSGEKLCMVHSVCVCSVFCASFDLFGCISELMVSAHYGSYMDHIAAYMLLNQTRDKTNVQLICAYIQSKPDVLYRLIMALFNSLLFARHDNQWVVVRPILSLLIDSEASFTDYQNQFISTQAPENQKKLLEEFDKLTADLQRSVETPTETASLRS